jgi:hypothetical protein
MINDLDRTLETLLKRSLENSLESQVSISFEPPDSQFPPSSVTPPAIDLFLYDIRENRDLRSPEWTLERQRDGSMIRCPPLTRIDCSYLITAWPSDGATGPTMTPAQEEHYLLGAVMKVLLRFPTLPSGLLQGELAGQEPPLPTATLQPGRLQSLAEFWQALGGQPKAAINYTVTIGLPARESVEGAPMVIEKQFRPVSPAAAGG